MSADNQVQSNLQNYLLSQGIISNQTVWQYQTGGRTNKVWRLKDERDLICKLYLDTKSNPLFNNSPKAEYLCLFSLDGSDIAPKPYKYLKTPFGDVLLYHYIKGKTWSHDVNTV